MNSIDRRPMPDQEGPVRGTFNVLGDGIGYVELIDSLGSDLDVVNAAKVSFLSEAKELGASEEGILRFLMRERHGTPFEHNFFKWRVKAPIFVFREWHRHRIASINEQSARYMELEREFYVPPVLHTQVGKPGRYTFDELPASSSPFALMHDTMAKAFDAYEIMLDMGVAKQEARMVLPVSTYSSMIWTVNARALMNFLSLRNAPTAQLEIKKYAEAMEQIWSDVMPITADAFVKNDRHAP